MSDVSAQDLINTLDELLDTERAALLKGDMDRLNRLAKRKEALIAKVDALGDLPKSALIPLQAKLQRNRDLIEHALDGIRAAADRMSEIRKARDGLQTYDRYGKKRDLPAPTTRAVEKRA